MFVRFAYAWSSGAPAFPRSAAWVGSHATIENDQHHGDALEVGLGVAHPQTKEVNVEMTDGLEVEIEIGGERGLVAEIKEDLGQGTGSDSGVPEVEREREAGSEEDLEVETGDAQGVEAGAGDPDPPVLAIKARKLRIDLGPKRKPMVGKVLKRRKKTKMTRRMKKKKMLVTLTRISWKKK